MASKIGKLLITSTPESVDDFLIHEKDFLFVFTNTNTLRRFFAQKPLFGDLLKVALNLKTL